MSQKLIYLDQESMLFMINVYSWNQVVKCLSVAFVCQYLL